MKEAMYRGPSASSLANSASSTDTLLATGTNAASASAPDLASKGQTLPPQYRWGLGSRNSQRQTISASFRLCTDIAVTLAF